MFPLCLNTSTIRPRPLREKIEVAARAGYDMVELWCDDVERFVGDGGTMASLRAQLRHAGLQVPSMIALGRWVEADAPGFTRLLGVAAERMEIAAALGCPRIVASPPIQTAHVELEVAGERYARLLSLGRRIGVLPMMEFLGFVPQIHDLRTCREVCARACDRDATVVLDPFHIYRGGGSFEEVLTVPGWEIGICHFNDAPRDKPRETQVDADRVQPGDGCLPLEDLVRSLRAVGYHGPLSLELFHPGLWEQDPEAVAVDGLRRMRGIIERASR